MYIKIQKRMDDLDVVDERLLASYYINSNDSHNRTVKSIQSRKNGNNDEMRFFDITQKEFVMPNDSNELKPWTWQKAEDEKEERKKRALMILESQSAQLQSSLDPTKINAQKNENDNETKNEAAKADAHTQAKPDKKVVQPYVTPPSYIRSFWIAGVLLTLYVTIGLGNAYLRLAN